MGRVLWLAPAVRIIGWLCVSGGVILSAGAFLIAIGMPAVNPWPSLVAGFALVAIGLGMLVATDRARHHR